uniref:Uncharacterized protein n=1 Tax=Noccaea caerulescens TaxID=107243 RepID=A0A1J3HMD8_NOCCA
MFFRLSVQYVKLSKRLLSSAPIAASLWGNTFATSANSDCGICRVGGRDKFFHCFNNLHVLDSAPDTFGGV